MIGSPPFWLIGSTLRMESDLVDKLDEAWRSRGSLAGQDFPATPLQNHRWQRAQFRRSVIRTSRCVATMPGGVCVWQP